MAHNLADREKVYIEIPGMPDIPGLKTRYFYGESDLPRMIRVFNACKPVDNTQWSLTLHDIRNNFEHMHNVDPFEVIVLGEIDGGVIFYNWIDWRSETDGDYVYHIRGYLDPAWRGKGIGTALIHFNETSIREIAASHPEDTPKYFQRWLGESQESLIRLLEDHGYKPHHHIFEMVRPTSKEIPEVPMPAGLDVRPVLPEHYRQVFDADYEAFRDHPGHHEPTEENYQEWLNQSIFKPGLWKVAWDGDQIAGMVLNYIDETENKDFNRKRGYTEDISVRRPWRKKGLARSLLVQSIRMFREMGMKETSLGVFVDNPSGALRLYESVGYEEKHRYMAYRKPL